MTTSTRFSVGIHILTLIEMSPQKVSSLDWIAGSVNVQIEIIQQTINQLMTANLIQMDQTKGSYQLGQSISHITFYDVYLAINHFEEDAIFEMHHSPNPQCPVGRNIQSAIEPIFSAAQQAVEKVLRVVTVEDIIQDIETTEEVDHTPH